MKAGEGHPMNCSVCVCLCVCVCVGGGGKDSGKPCVVNRLPADGRRGRRVRGGWLSVQFSSASCTHTKTNSSHLHISTWK